MVPADTLSKASLNTTDPSSTELDVQVHVDGLQKRMPVSEQKQRQIATADDKELQVVIERILQPGDLRLIHPYQNFKDELTVMDDIVLKRNRIVIPTSMRPEVTKLIHEGHLGIEKCKR